MRRIPADYQLPLPKGWPKRIRSSVIQTISMAHFSVTFARSVAANSITARIRLKAENDRLRQEIAPLCRRDEDQGLPDVANPGPAETSLSTHRAHGDFGAPRRSRLVRIPDR